MKGNLFIGLCVLFTMTFIYALSNLGEYNRNQLVSKLNVYPYEVVNINGGQKFFCKGILKELDGVNCVNLENDIKIPVLIVSVGWKISKRWYLI